MDERAKENFIPAVQLLFQMFPVDMASWIAPKILDGCKLLEVYYIARHSDKFLYAVPNKEKISEPENQLDGMMRELFANAILGEETVSKVEVIKFDFEESMRQSMLEGGFDINLAVTVEDYKGKSRAAIIGVPLLPPDFDGSEIDYLLIKKMSWQMTAYEKLIAGEDTMVMAEDVKSLLIFNVPIYLWHGTGLKDVEEFCWQTKKLSTSGFLGKMIEDSTSEKKRQRERESNQQVLEYRQKKMRERFDASEKRRQLMGDAMISEEELKNLWCDVDIENDFFSLWGYYNIIRVWEQSVDDLLESLPTGGLGLALFGYSSSNESKIEIFRRCAWLLRGRLSGASALETERSIYALAQLGKLWLTDEEIFNIFKPLKYRT